MVAAVEVEMVAAEEVVAAATARTPNGERPKLLRKTVRRLVALQIATTLLR
jgi:L-lactate permease